MTPEPTLYTNSAAPIMTGGILALIIILGIREGIRKAIALWKAGKGNQLARFICLFIFNTAGILPILYLIFWQKKGSKKK
ncbi:MAG: DUF5652 family protein [Candidatus Absconditicoccaceae bacterium]